MKWKFRIRSKNTTNSNPERRGSVKFHIPQMTNVPVTNFRIKTYDYRNYSIEYITQWNYSNGKYTNSQQYSNSNLQAPLMAFARYQSILGVSGKNNGKLNLDYFVIGGGFQVWGLSVTWRLTLNEYIKLVDYYHKPK